MQTQKLTSFSWTSEYKHCLLDSLHSPIHHWNTQDSIEQVCLQEAIDRVASIKQKEAQLEQIQLENARCRELEDNFEDMQVLFTFTSAHPVCFMLLLPLLSVVER